MPSCTSTSRARWRRNGGDERGDHRPRCYQAHRERLGAICDATVAVTAPEEVRVKRIMARDSITEEYARSRIAAQKDADYFRAQCDYEFVNDLPTAEKAEHAAEVYINTIINNLKEETER